MPSVSKPVLLILDNHASHLDQVAINLAKKNGVVLATFPPHTTDKLPPLDEAVYNPLKTFYNTVCNEWQLTNLGKTIITLYDLGELACRSIERALTPQNIRSGFRTTGIVPMN